MPKVQPVLDVPGWMCRTLNDVDLSSHTCWTALRCLSSQLQNALLCEEQIRFVRVETWIRWFVYSGQLVFICCYISHSFFTSIASLTILMDLDSMRSFEQIMPLCYHFLKFFFKILLSSITIILFVLQTASCSVSTWRCKVTTPTDFL